MEREPVDLHPNASPELAVALRTAAPRIEQKWLALVKQALPDAADASHNEIRINLPHVFDEMIAASNREDSEDSAAIRGSAHHHAVECREIEFNLRDVLIEYELLRRRLCCGRAADELTRPLRVQEMIAINSGIDFVLRRCVLEFAQQQAREVASSAGCAQAKHLSLPLTRSARIAQWDSADDRSAQARNCSSTSRSLESLEDLDVMRFARSLGRR